MDGGMKKSPLERACPDPSGGFRGVLRRGREESWHFVPFWKLEVGAAPRLFLFWSIN